MRLFRPRALPAGASRARAAPPPAPPVALLVDGAEVTVPAGATLAAAVARAGRAACRVSVSGEARGPLCGMGVCQECRVTVDGRPHVLACMAPCAAGMRLETGDRAPASAAAPREGRAATARTEQPPLRAPMAEPRTAPCGPPQPPCVLVVGGGPAGIAAAVCAAEAGARVILVDAGLQTGGQAWRGGAGGGRARRWHRRLAACGAEVRRGVQVVAPVAPGVLLAEEGGAPVLLPYGRLVLAPGARERFLPFPGWTLPGVSGAGGLQAMAKNGLDVSGRHVVVAGTGPLLLAAAASLRARGARVILVAEQAPRRAALAFAREVARPGGRLGQALALGAALRGTPYRWDAWVLAAHGTEALEAVTLRLPSGPVRIPCEGLACGFGLVANVELPLALGCAVRDDRVAVDADQRTTVAGVYCAGDAAGAGGLEGALAEGAVAGCAAAGRPDLASGARGARERARRFGAAIAAAFALRPELRGLPAEDTIICRCEDVPLGAVRAAGGWREAKLQARCGMGPCQGRICGPAAEFLLGWGAAGVRPPVAPALVGTLAALAPAPGPGSPAEVDRR